MSSGKPAGKSCGSCQSLAAPSPESPWWAARKWEELAGDVIGATVLMQADIRYYQPSEIAHAWHWIKTAKYADDLPVRTMLSPGHVMSGYTPEYTDL